MIKRILSYFNSSKAKNQNKEVILEFDEVLLSKIKAIPLDKDYISNLKLYLLELGFENINVIKGENILMTKQTVANECCIDIFFEKNYLYMLTIFEDGIQLLKNKNQIVRTMQGYTLEDIEYENIYKVEVKKSILSILEKEVA